MEIDKDIERVFIETFQIKYNEKSNKMASGDLFCSIYGITLQNTTDGKIRADRCIHYTEIQEIQFEKSNVTIITLKDKSPPIKIEMNDPKYIYKIVFLAFKYFFPFENVFSFVKVVNTAEHDLKDVQELVNNLPINNVTPCHNFTSGIHFCAQSKGGVVNDEITWDIDTVYASKDSRRFVLRDFDHLLKPKYLTPVLTTLGYNTFFVNISLSHVELEPFEKVLEQLFTYNRKIEKLEMVSCKLRQNTLNLIINGLSKVTHLKYLDLSQNENLGDKGAEMIARFIEDQGGKLETFKMAECGLTSISLDRFGAAFKHCMKGKEQNNLVLKVLDLSGNSLKDGFNTTFLKDVLENSVDLEELYLSSMNTIITPLAKVLVKSCHKLRILDLSGNIPNLTRKMSDWCEFFTQTSNLVQINLSHFKLTDDDVFDGLIYGLIANDSIKTNMELNVSHCNLKGSHFEKFCQIKSKIEKLDLSYNELGLEFQYFIDIIPEFKTLKSLNLSGNFHNVKDMNQMILNLSNNLQYKDVNVEELNLSNCNFGSSLSYLISDIDCLLSLRFLDVSGNNLGKVVARTIGRMLTIDKHLKQINIDNNGIPKEMYEEILDNLETNYTLDTFQVPFVDLAKCNPKLVSPIIDKINQHHQKMHRIYQGLSLNEIKNIVFDNLLEHSYQSLDMYKSSLEEVCNRLHDLQETKEIKECLDNAKELLKDFQIAKGLELKLKEVFDEKSDQLSPEKNVQKILSENVSVLKNSFNAYIEEVFEEMLNITEKEMPNLFQNNNSNFRQIIMDKCHKSCQISEVYIQKLFNKFIEVNIKNKVIDIQSNLKHKLKDLVVEKLTSEIMLVDKKANNLLANPSTSPVPQISIEETSETVTTRENRDKKKDKTLSIRASRTSFLTATTARPISKAIINDDGQIISRNNSINHISEEIFDSQSSTENNLISTINKNNDIKDNNIKNKDKNDAKKEERKKEKEKKEQKLITKQLKINLKKEESITKQRSSSESNSLDSILEQSTDDDNKKTNQPIPKARKLIIPLKLPSNNRSSKNMSITKDDSPEPSVSTPISATIKARPKPPSNNPKKNVIVEINKSTEDLDKFLENEKEVDLSGKAPVKKSGFSLFKSKKNDINLDNLGKEYTEESDNRPRAASSVSKKTPERINRGKKNST